MPFQNVGVKGDHAPLPKEWACSEHMEFQHRFPVRHYGPTKRGLNFWDGLPMLGLCVWQSSTKTESHTTHVLLPDFRQEMYATLSLWVVKC